MTTDQSIIFGIHPLQELLTAKRRQVYRIYTTNPAPKAFGAIRSLLPAHLTVTIVSREQLTARAGTADHQGVVAIVGTLPVRSRCFDPAKSPFIVLLDGVQDPRNMGAIIRSACCAGADGVVIPHKQSAPLEGTVCKSSAGLIEHIDLYQPASSAQAVRELQAAGYHLYLAAFKGVDMRTVAYQAPLCLVIGSEGTGITPSLLSQGTQVTIPQYNGAIKSGNALSYNASVAAGILLCTIACALRKV